MPVFDRVRSDWGLEIRPNSLVVEDVGYDPEYQAALKAESEAEFKANPKQLIKQKENQMASAVAALDFETAALLRDEIKIISQSKS